MAYEEFFNGRRKYLKAEVVTHENNELGCVDLSDMSELTGVQTKCETSCSSVLDIPQLTDHLSRMLSN